MLRQKKTAERKNQEKRGDVDYVTPIVTYSNSLKTSGYAHILMGWFQPSMPKPKTWGVANSPTLKESTITYTIHGMIIQAWLLAFLGLVALEYGSIDMYIYMNALWVCRIACANQKPGGYLK